MLKRYVRCGTWAATMIMMLGVVSAYAVQELQRPTGTLILKIAGNVEKTNAADTAEFDVAMLERIGVTRLQTSTPWTEGRPVFEGVLLRDLLNEVGADGDTVVATALNDYKVEIPASDFERYPVVLAYKMDGKRLSVREKGPLWIIYPQDEFKELRTKTVQSRWVWQVKELNIQ